MLFDHDTRGKSASPSSAGYGIARYTKKAILWNPIRLFCLLALLVVTSCGKDSPTGPAGPANVVVTPNTVTLTAIGQTVQLDAKVQYEAGATSSGHTVVWASRNPSVASVNSGGLVTALSNGTADITATAGQKQGKSTITVSQAA
ncbi:MAG: Ig-like domain-containing protein, partial [Gemmatimonadetes bacterium]|nr:Ig-like domain-containing protein [Gemmatimonadota bacterium]